METNDTEKLLRECDAGTKMAVSSIDEVLGAVRNTQLRTLLDDSRIAHTQLGNEIHSLLGQSGTDTKNPNPISKGMSWLKTNVRLGMDTSDATVADLMTDGCNMGVKSLYKYLNEYEGADGASKGICNRLATIEEQLAVNLRAYL